MTAAKAAAKKAANARGRDQWMRATLLCRHKPGRAAWRTRGGGDSFCAEGILAAVPLIYMRSADVMTKSWSIDSAALSSKRAFSSAKSVQLDRPRT
jgi:hypothetical protein